MNTPVGTSSAPPPPPPGGDTQPPSTPTGLAATGATQSSISTSWQASSDNVGVAGYDVFVNGSKVGTATGTSFTFTGLACGTQYTLAVDAFDGAGNRSGQTSVIAATSACSTGTANVFVSPSGSDSNACTQSAPCRSFQRAYQDAQPGDVVQVAGGTYSDTDLNLDSSKTSSTDVIFQPAAGATVRLSNRLTIRARHLEIRNMTMEYTLWATAADVTMRNIRVPGTWTIFSDGSQAPTDISIIGGDVGPSADSNDIIGANGPAATVSPRNILIDGVSFHDFTLSPGSSAHVECLQVWAVNGLTINHSKFRNCFVFDIFLQHFPGGSVPSPSNVTIENSFFDCCGTGGDFQPAIRYGDHPGEPFSNVLIAYNSLNKDINLANATGVTYQNVRIIANIGPRLDTEGPVPPGVTSDYNVWFSGSRIGSHDQVAPSGFRDPANFDFHLVSGAAAINHGDPTNFPPNDIDGDPRPLGAGVDAGADEVP
jgi:chitodextrinase